VRRLPRETSDAGFEPLAALALCAAGVILAGAAAQWAGRRALDRVTRARSGTRLVFSPSPPAPRLQARPADDLAALRAREDAALSAWGWSDRRAGLARVPIERAMELVVEESR
jgi:hypothetical protein